MYREYVLYSDFVVDRDYVLYRDFVVCRDFVVYGDYTAYRYFVTLGFRSICIGIFQHKGIFKTHEGH